MMRSAIFILSGAVAFCIGAASAEPGSEVSGGVLQTTETGNLTCAARFTFAASAIHDLDASAAAYYAERAAAAGKRYLALHPSESERAYSARVAAGAKALRQRLMDNVVAPESLLAEIQNCDRLSDSQALT